MSDLPQRRLVCIGYGSVAQCFLAIVATWKGGELLKRLNIVSTHVLTKDITDAQIEKLKGWKMEAVRIALSGATAEETLTPWFSGDEAKGIAPSFVVNLTTGVNSLVIQKIARKCGALSLDTSASEYWPEEEDTMEGEFGEEGSNYMCREEFLEYGRNLPKGSSTGITCLGANPGMVTLFLKRALARMLKEKNGKTIEQAGGWASAAEELGVRAVHIAERDTQVPKKPRIPHEEFTGTWSVDGFILEGCKQCADVGWGTHEKTLPEKGAFYSKGCGAAIRIAQPSVSVRCLTWVPTFGEEVGCVVTHYETTSIANMLTKKDTSGKAVYRPTVHYAYHCCEASLEAMAEIEQDNWNVNHHKVHRVYGPDEIQDGGADELGVLICTNSEFGTVWYGSTVYNEEAIAVAPDTQATTIQVAAGVIGGLLWMTKHPDRGLVEPEDIEEYEEFLDNTKPFLGKLHMARCSWTPRGGDPTNEDTWQFENFRVRGTYDPTVKRIHYNI